MKKSVKKEKKVEKRKADGDVCNILFVIFDVNRSNMKCIVEKEE